MIFYETRYKFQMDNERKNNQANIYNQSSIIFSEEIKKRVQSAICENKICHHMLNEITDFLKTGFSID